MALKRGDWLMAALTAEAETDKKVVEATKEADAADEVLDVAALTVKEIEEKVDAGDLSAEEVYAAELAGKQRKGVLAQYAPADDNEQGTGEDSV